MISIFSGLLYSMDRPDDLEGGSIQVDLANISLFSHIYNADEVSVLDRESLKEDLEQKKLKTVSILLEMCYRCRVDLCDGDLFQNSFFFPQWAWEEEYPEGLIKIHAIWQLLRSDYEIQRDIGKITFLNLIESLNSTSQEIILKQLNSYKMSKERLFINVCLTLMPFSVIGLIGYYENENDLWKNKSFKLVIGLGGVAALLYGSIKVGCSTQDYRWWQSAKRFQKAVAICEQSS